MGHVSLRRRDIAPARRREQACARIRLRRPATRSTQLHRDDVAKAAIGESDDRRASMRATSARTEHDASSPSACVNAHVGYVRICANSLNDELNANEIANAREFDVTPDDLTATSIDTRLIHADRRLNPTPGRVRSGGARPQSFLSCVSGDESGVGGNARR